MVDERARGLALVAVLVHPDGLDDAVERADDELLVADRPGHADRAFLRFAQGAALSARYRDRGASADARAAGAAFEEALKTCPKDDPWRGTYLFELASIALAAAAAPSEQDDALALLARCAEAVGREHPSYSKRLSALASARGEVAARRRDRSAMAAALVEHERAIEAAHPDDPRRAAFLHAQAMTLRASAELTGSPAQQEQANRLSIRAAREAHPYAAVV